MRSMNKQYKYSLDDNRYSNEEEAKAVKKLIKPTCECAADARLRFGWSASRSLNECFKKVMGVNPEDSKNEVLSNPKIVNRWFRDCSLDRKRYMPELSSSQVNAVCRCIFNALKEEIESLDRRTYKCLKNLGLE